MLKRLLFLLCLISPSLYAADFLCNYSGILQPAPHCGGVSHLEVDNVRAAPASFGENATQYDCIYNDQIAPLEGSRAGTFQCVGTCSDNEIFNQITRQCESTCLAPRQDIAGSCECPLGTTYNETNNTCDSICADTEYFNTQSEQCEPSGNCDAKSGGYALNGATLPMETLPYYYCGGDGCTSTRVGGNCTLPDSPDFPLCQNVTYLYDGTECDPNANGDGGGNNDPTDTCHTFQGAGTPCYAMCQSTGAGVGSSSYNCSTGDVIEQCVCSVTNEPPDMGDGSGDGSNTGDGSGDSTDTTGDGQTDTGDTDGDGDSDGDTNNDGDSDFGDIIDAISEQTRQINEAIQKQQTQAKIDAQRAIDAQSATTSSVEQGTADTVNAINALSNTTSGNFQQNTAALNANGLRLDAANTELEAQTQALADIKTAIEQGNAQENNDTLTTPEGQDRQTVQEVGNKVLAAWESMKNAPIINAGFAVFESFPSGGSCPSLGFNVSLFGSNINAQTTVHCDLYNDIAPTWSLVMFAFWAIVAVLVFKRF